MALDSVVFLVKYFCMNALNSPSSSLEYFATTDFKFIIFETPTTLE